MKRLALGRRVNIVIDVMTHGEKRRQWPDSPAGRSVN